MKQVLRKIGGMPGLSNLARRRKRGPVILFYHGVEEAVVDRQVQNIHLELADFEQQIAYLRKHYEIISLDDLQDCVSQQAKADPRHVVLTFDDGYRNNRTVVAPYLDSLGVPYAIFVSTRHIDENLRFPTYYLRAVLRHSRSQTIEIRETVLGIGDDRGRAAALKQVSRNLKTAPLADVEAIVASLKAQLPNELWAELDERYASDAPMSWQEVGELEGLGATVGSHCHDHCILHERQPAAEIERQLRLSKELIERVTGSCRYIAYPNGSTGDMCDAALEQARRGGYALGLTTVEGEIEARTNPYLLPRISADTSEFDRFKFNLNLAFRYNEKYRQWAGL